MKATLQGCVLTAGMLLASAAEAGPWAVGKGGLYAKLSYQYRRSTTLAAPDGTLFEIPRFSQQDAAAFMAYGLNGRITLMGSTPFLRSSDLLDVPDELGRETGFGDLQLGAQVQLGTGGGWVFAVRGLVQVPTGDETRGNGLLPMGSGSWEGLSVVGAGRSFAGGRVYGYLEVGYNLRGSGLRDGFLYETQVGWNVARRLVLAANLRGLEPWSRKPGAFAPSSFVGVGDGVTYLTYGPSAIVRFGKDWGAQLDVEGAAHVKNIAKGIVYRIGITYQR